MATANTETIKGGLTPAGKKNIIDALSGSFKLFGNNKKYLDNFAQKIFEMYDAFNEDDMKKYNPSGKGHTSHIALFITDKRSELETELQTIKDFIDEKEQIYLAREKEAEDHPFGRVPAKEKETGRKSPEKVFEPKTEPVSPVVTPDPTKEAEDEAEAKRKAEERRKAKEAEDEAEAKRKAEAEMMKRKLTITDDTKFVRIKKALNDIENETKNNKKSEESKPISGGASNIMRHKSQILSTKLNKNFKQIFSGMLNYKNMVN